MFCNYCGKPNPDDGSFCSSCGKPITRSLSGQSPIPAVPPAPVAQPPAAPAPAQTPRTVATVATVATPAAKPKKRKFLRWATVVLGLAVAVVLIYPHKDGNTICSATQEIVVEQVPYAIDILAARHPIEIGLVRSLLNDQGQVDRFAENYVRGNLQQQDPSTLACYAGYYIVTFDKDEVRTLMADGIERDLNLNNLTNASGGNGGSGTNDSGESGANNGNSGGNGSSGTGGNN